MTQVFSRRLFAFGMLVALALMAPSTGHADAVIDSLTAGDLEIQHVKPVYKSGHIDLFLSIKNNSSADEKLTGADTTLKYSAIVEVTKDKNGKESEAPIGEALTAEKTTEFDKDSKWLRLKVESEPKESDIFPVTLTFRRSPNANLRLALDPSKAAKAFRQETAAPVVAAPVPAASAPSTAAPAASDSSDTAAPAPAQKKSIFDWFKK